MLKRTRPWLVLVGSAGVSQLGEMWKKQTSERKSQVLFQGKRTFHQALLRVSFTLPGLGSCSRTKVLTAADYSNKSRSFRGGVTQRTGMQKGLPEGPEWPEG